MPYPKTQGYPQKKGFLSPINRFNAPNGVKHTLETAPNGAVFLSIPQI